MSRWILIVYHVVNRIIPLDDDKIHLVQHNESWYILFARNCYYYLIRPYPYLDYNLDTLCGWHHAFTTFTLTPCRDKQHVPMLRLETKDTPSPIVHRKPSDGTTGSLCLTLVWQTKFTQPYVSGPVVRCAATPCYTV